MPVCQTDRLTLEELCLVDDDFTLELLNDPGFIQWIGDRGVRNRQQARDYLTNGPIASYRRHGFGMWAVRLRSTRATLGICGLVRRPALQDVDLGYAFLPAARGQGYALEAARAVFAHATGPLALKRLVAIVTPGNTASTRLLEQLGMHFERQLSLQPGEDPVDLYAWQAGCQNR